MSDHTGVSGQRVRSIRMAKNISQEKLALSCNLDRSYMGRIERGEVNPTLERIYEIAQALDVTPGDLLP